MSRLLVRADAGTAIGSGHVMRCLALAQAWRAAGGAVTFASASLPPSMEERLRVEGMEIETLAVEAGCAADARETAVLAERIQAAWIAVDGYAFDSEYQRALKAAGRSLLWIDDEAHAPPYCADIVLNQNLHARESAYDDRSARTRLLLGPRYVLLRQEFLRRRPERPAESRTLLVSLGGADPANFTLEVIRALREAPVADLEVVVVAGPGNPHAAALESELRPMSGWRLVRNAADMPALLAAAGAAIIAGGTTCWELAWFGVPAAVVALAPNQRPVMESVHEAGIALRLGWHEDVGRADIVRAVATLLKEGSLREAMSVRGRALIDGRGAARVVEQMR